ncbi:MAG: porin family protein [Chitinophagales bacterium]
MKTKMTLILLAFFATINANAQQVSTEPIVSAFNKFQIGVNFSTDYNYRTLKATDAVSNFVKEERNLTEFPKISYTTGLNICFNFTNNIGVETGLQYSNKGYKNRAALFFEEDLLSSIVNPPLKYKLTYNFHYLDVPLMANFSFGKRKVRFISSVGLTTNFLIKQKSKSVLEGENAVFTTSNAFNKVNFSPTISFGIDYKINEMFNLRVQPTFRYGMAKIKDAPVTAYLWNAGINVGVYL